MAVGDTKVMRAVCYPRVSSTKQRDAHTIESQLRMLPEFIARMGWQLAAPPDVYIDDGKTAKAGHLDKRRGLANLLRDAAAGRFDVVAVVDQDRLTRAEDIIERATIIGSLQRAGVKVASAISGQVLDLDTSHGDLMASLGGFFAAEWSRKHRARIMEGKATAISRGRKPAGPTPYGLTYERATGLWSVDAERAAVVRLIFGRVIEGMPLRQIALRLEADSVPRTRQGAWSHARIAEIVRAPTYCGEWRANKRSGVTIKVPPIIDQTTWEAAQAALRARRPPNWTRGRHVNLCQGLGICGVCGEPMCVTGGLNTIRYYVCRNKKRCGAEVERCANRMRAIEDTDAQVWERLQGVVLDDNLLAEALGTARPDDGADLERELAGYERRLKQMDRAEADILSMYRRGKISPGAFERELAGSARDRQVLERNRDVVRERLGRVALAGTQTEELMRGIRELRARIDKTSPQERRALLRLLVPPGVGAITMRPDGIEIVGLFPTPGSSNSDEGVVLSVAASA